MENWIDIKGFEGLYQVSNLGNIRSLDREITVGYNNHKRTYKGRMLKKVVNGVGYEVVILNTQQRREYMYVHQIVVDNFININRTGLVIDHINNIKTDNRLKNLQITTYRINTSKDKNKSKTTSEYTGVHYNKKINRWRASAVINGKSRHIGYYDDEISAHEAYKNKINSL
jgi:hypothetical protein